MMVVVLLGVSLLCFSFTTFSKVSWSQSSMFCSTRQHVRVGGEAAWRDVGIYNSGSFSGPVLVMMNIHASHTVVWSDVVLRCGVQHDVRSGVVWRCGVARYSL